MWNLGKESPLGKEWVGYILLLGNILIRDIISQFLGVSHLSVTIILLFIIYD